MYLVADAFQSKRCFIAVCCILVMCSGRLYQAHSAHPTVSWIADGVNLLFNVAALGWSLAMIIAPLVFDPPLIIFSVLPLALSCFKMVKVIYLYRGARIVGTARQTLAAALAGLALSHTIAKAMWHGLFTRDKPFLRTPKMEQVSALLRAIGAEPVFNARHLTCCGKACQDESISSQIMIDNLAEFTSLEVDALGLLCPTCFDEYDLGQLQISRKFKKDFRVPVFYYFQLLGLAQGCAPEEVGLQRHKISTKPVLERLSMQKAAVGA